MDLLKKYFRIEEENFGRTLERGIVIITARERAARRQRADGETVFKLYDTYGFPADLTNDVARERDFTIVKKALKGDGSTA